MAVRLEIQAPKCSVRNGRRHLAQSCHKNPCSTGVLEDNDEGDPTRPATALRRERREEGGEEEKTNPKSQSQGLVFSSSGLTVRHRQIVTFVLPIFSESLIRLSTTVIISTFLSAAPKSFGMARRGLSGSGATPHGLMDWSATQGSILTGGGKLEVRPGL